MKLYYKGMQAVHLEGGKVSVRDVPIPARPPGFALLRLVVGGICNTDLELQRGYYGFSGTPGHEFVAEGAEAGTAGLVGEGGGGGGKPGGRGCGWGREGTGGHRPQRAGAGTVKNPGGIPGNIH